MSRCVSRLRFTGPEPQIMRLCSEAVAASADGRAAISFAALSPTPTGVTFHELLDWADRHWGTRVAGPVPGRLLARRPGYTELEVVTPLGSPVPWALAVAQLLELDLEVLWNEQSGHAGQVTATAAGVSCLSVPVDSLPTYGWDDPPYLQRVDPADIAVARTLIDRDLFPVEYAARMLLPDEGLDPFEYADGIAQLFVTMSRIERRRTDELLDTLIAADEQFGSVVQAKVAPLLEPAA